MATNEQTHEFQRWWAEAVAAGRQAAKEVAVQPIAALQHRHPADDASPITATYIIPDGMCGFAWVVVRPATTAFARWARKWARFTSHYGGGIHYNVFEYNQSMTRKFAFAKAAANVLRKHGIHATADCRAD